MSAWFSIARGVAWRVLWKIVRNPAILAPQMIFPLFFFSAFAGGLSGLDRLPSFVFPPGYTAFVFVFVLLQTAAFGGVFTGFGIAADFEWGFARRLFLAAPRRSAIVAGYALAALGRWAGTGSLLTAVALATGMPMPGSAAEIVGLYTLALLVNVAGVLWACGVAMRFRSLQAGPVMQMPTFMILFFAPVYVPLDLLDGWLKATARVNPVTHILEAGRSLLAGTPADVLTAFAIAGGIIVGLGLWALRGLRSAERAAA